MYKRGAKGWAKHWDFILLDCISLELSLLIAYWIRHGFINPINNTIYRNLFILVLFINFFALIIFNTFKDVIKRGFFIEAQATVIHALILTFGILAYIFAIKESSLYSRLTIGMMGVFYIASSYIIRVIWKQLLRNRLKTTGATALLILTTKDQLSNVINNTKNKNNFMYRIVGAATEDESIVGKSVNDIDVVATYDNLVEYVTKHWVDEILVSMSFNDNLSDDIIDSLIDMGITIHFHINEPNKTVQPKQALGNIGDMLVITASLNFMTAMQYAVKRLMDILISIFGCIFTLIICVFIGPIIYIASPGPLFFTQTRIGKNGKPFKFYKFRSMYLDAEERKAELMKQNRINSDFMFKMEFDPRVIGNKIDENGKRHTGIGEFIRKYSLDEFPQFFNVLKGDMSVVGTRPPLVNEYEKYSPHHKARLAIKPGITGLWQVSGRSNILDFDEVVKLDTEYINNWSVSEDIKIFFKTFTVVFKHEGSM